MGETTTLSETEGTVRAETLTDAALKTHLFTAIPAALTSQHADLGTLTPSGNQPHMTCLKKLHLYN